MEQIKKNTVPSSNQLNGSEYVTFDHPYGTGIRVLFVGNSITRHAPKPAIGWNLDCGMAASCTEADYVHLLIRRFREADPNAAFCICQVAEWERNYRNGMETFPLYVAAKDFRANVIFFRLIENVSCKEFDGEIFKREYAALVDYLNPTGNAKIILSSGFWKHDGDAMIREVAADRGYPYVYLGDLGEDDRMKAIGLFDHNGVANHPGDLGMKVIAERLWRGAGFR